MENLRSDASYQIDTIAKNRIKPPSFFPSRAQVTLKPSTSCCFDRCANLAGNDLLDDLYNTLRRREVRAMARFKRERLDLASGLFQPLDDVLLVG